MIDLDQGWIERIIKWLNSTARLTTSALASPTGSDTNVVTGTAGSANDQAVWDANGDVVGLEIPAFRAYHDTSQNTGNGAYAFASFNTESYDYGSNFSGGIFTAPVKGVYHFDAVLRTNAAFSRVDISLFVDAGSGYSQAMFGDCRRSGTTLEAMKLSGDIELNVGDKARVYTYGNAAIALFGGVTNCHFSGHLVRAT